MKEKAILWLGVLLACCTAVAAQDTLRLRVMTYNLRFGELASLEELSGVIREQRPDLVALQEADRNTARDGVPHQHGRDFVTELGYRTGMMPLYGKAIDYAGGLYGVGVLTSLPYVGVRKALLPKGEPSEEQRVLLMAVLEAGAGDTIVFASTHFDHLRDGTQRMQARTVVGEAARSRWPLLVGGDLNAAAGAEAIRIMSQGRMLCDTVPTFPARDPDVRLDYLFGFPAARWELESTRVIDSQRSDHRPVLSVVRLVR